jgi:hypothetical protein
MQKGHLVNFFFDLKDPLSIIYKKLSLLPRSINYYEPFKPYLCPPPKNFWDPYGLHKNDFLTSQRKFREVAPLPPTSKTQYNSNLKTLHCFQVSWIRRRDSHILSVDQTIFISDGRFRILRPEPGNEWNLHIK